MSETPVYVSRDIMNSFMAHVEQKSGKDGCWLWKGGVHKKNTPSFSYTENKVQKNQPARAFIHQRTTGEIGAAKGGVVSYRPKCGDPLCVKPSHIQVISMREIMLELKSKQNAAVAVTATPPVTEKVVKPEPAVVKPEPVVTRVTAKVTTNFVAPAQPAAEIAKQMIADYKNKNPLQFLAGPIKEAIAKQKQKISITQSLVADLEKELALFENELKRVEG